MRTNLVYLKSIVALTFIMMAAFHENYGQVEMEDAGTARDTVVIEENDNFKDPNKALMLSLIFPGTGQVYNEKVWKLPIMYGGVATAIYFLEFNNRRYQQFLVALNIVRGGTEPNPFPNLNQDGIIRNVDYWRRNRDLMFMVFGGIYIMAAVDAFVDAHLSSFDVSEDLSFKVNPSIEPILAQNAALGIGLKIKF